MLGALQPAQRERGRQQFGTQRRSGALQCQAGLIGIAISWILKDVPASLLLLGTVSSAATGLLGAAVTKLFVKR